MVPRQNIMNTETEHEYIVRMSQGDTRSFETLFLAWHPRLIGFLEGFVKNEETARDMAQDIFFTIWEQREKFVEIRSFGAYLFRMARNAVYNYHDRKHVHDRFENASSRSETASSNEVEEALFVQELESLIQLAVSNMPPQRELIYRLSREKNLSNEEIAQMLHISKRTVENHLSLALSDIRKIVKICILFFYH